MLSGGCSRRRLAQSLLSRYSLTVKLRPEIAAALLLLLVLADFLGKAHGFTMLLDITAALVFKVRALLPSYLHMHQEHARISHCVVRRVVHFRRLEGFLGLPVV